MKMKFVLLMSAVLFASAAHAATVLPDACGSDKVKFDVKTQKTADAPASPAEGKAQIIFIETETVGGLRPPKVTTRFGLDGAWAGAATNNTYFVMDIAPGEHHLCSSVQESYSAQTMNKIGLDSFTAETGKVYYYEFKISMMRMGVTMNGASGTGAALGSGLSRLSEDEGKYRVKASKVSQSTAK